MNPFQVRELVGGLEAAFPDPPLADATGALYQRMLADLGDDDADAAIDELIATTARLPPIGRIRRAVIEPRLDLPTAEGWLAVQGRGGLRLVGRAAQLLGGTFNVGTSEDPELTRVRFARVYEGLRRREVDGRVAAGVRASRTRLPAASQRLGDRPPG